MKSPNLDIALEISQYKNELDTNDIMRIFNVKQNAAHKYKKAVRARQVELNVKTWYSYHINLKVAYEVWNIDIEDAIRKKNARKKLGL